MEIRELTLVFDGRGYLLEVKRTRAIVTLVQGVLGRVIGPGSHLEGQSRAVFDRLDTGNTGSSIDVFGWSLVIVLTRIKLR